VLFPTYIALEEICIGFVFWCALAGSANLDPRARRALQFLERLLLHRFRYDVEIDEAPRIQAGEFDIEIEE